MTSVMLVPALIMTWCILRINGALANTFSNETSPLILESFVVLFTSAQATGVYDHTEQLEPGLQR